MAAGLYSIRSAIFRIETLLVALADEEVAGRVEDGPADGLAVAFVTFLDAHRLSDPEQCSLD